MICRKIADLTQNCHTRPSEPGPTLSCNSSGTRIGLPGPYRAHPPARWHRFVSIERREPLQTALQGISARAMICRKIADLTQTCHARPSEPGPTLSFNSSGTAIAIPRASMAHPLARWHRFVSIESREPLQTALQGTFARAMLCRKITEDQRPATHGPQSPVSARLGPVKARPYAFLKFTWHPNRPYRALQGTSARAMTSICVHRAPRTPPDSTPRHIPVPGGTKLGSPGPISGAN